MLIDSPTLPNTQNNSDLSVYSSSLLHRSNAVKMQPKETDHIPLLLATSQKIYLYTFSLTKSCAGIPSELLP